MSESIHEFVVTQLKEAKGRLPEVAQASGVPWRTLGKIARREIEDPGIGSIDKLVSYYGVDRLITYLRGKSRRRIQELDT